MMMMMMRVCLRKSASGWILILSGVSQGSVIGPLLFLIYVNDIPDWIKGNIQMFADDTKIWTVLRSYNDTITLQSHLNSLLTWSNTWLLRFNTEKCTTVHIGKHFSSTYHLYEGNDTIDLSATHCERDLGVHV